MCVDDMLTWDKRYYVCGTIQLGNNYKYVVVENQSQDEVLFHS